MQNQYKCLYKDKNILKNYKRNEARNLNRIDKLETIKNQRSEYLNKLRGIPTENLTKIEKKSKIDSNNRLEKLIQWKAARELKQQAPSETKAKVFKVAHFSPTEYTLGKINKAPAVNTKNMIVNQIAKRETRSMKNPTVGHILKPNVAVTQRKHQFSMTPSFSFVDDALYKSLSFGVAKKIDSINEGKQINNNLNKSIVMKNEATIKKSYKKVEVNIKDNKLVNENQETRVLRNKVIIINPPSSKKTEIEPKKTTKQRSLLATRKNTVVKDKKVEVAQSIINVNEQKINAGDAVQLQKIEPFNDISAKSSLNVTEILPYDTNFPFSKVTLLCNSGIQEISLPINTMNEVADEVTNEVAKTPTSIRSSSRKSLRNASSGLVKEDFATVSLSSVVPQTTSNEAELLHSSSKKRKTNETESSDANLYIDVPENAEFFRKILKTEIERLSSMCFKWNGRQAEESFSEEVCDQIRTSVGKAELLMRKRMTQFGKLIDENEFETGERPVTHLDLRGFWDIVAQQIADVDNNFNRIIILLEGRPEVPMDILSAKKDKFKPIKSKIAIAKTRAGVSGFAQFRKQLKTKTAESQQIPDESNVTEDSLRTFDGGFFKVASPQRIMSNIKTPDKSSNSSNLNRTKTLLPASPFLKMVLTKQFEKSLENQKKSSLTPIFKSQLHIDSESRKNSYEDDKESAAFLNRRSSSRRTLKMLSCADDSEKKEKSNRKSRKSVCFGGINTFDNKENDYEETDVFKPQVVIAESESLKMDSFKKLNLNYTPAQRRVSGFTPPRLSKVGLLKFDDEDDALMTFSPLEPANQRRSQRYSVKTKNLSPIID